MGLKKVWDEPAMTREMWITHGDTVSMMQQCVLAMALCATVHECQKPNSVDEFDLLHSCLSDDEYTRRPFYGSRKRIFSKLGGTSSIVNGNNV